MKLSEIINKSRINADLKFGNDLEITGLNYDSRKIKPGNIFFAIKGLKEDGNKYVSDAINNGAAVIFSEDDIKAETKVPVIRSAHIRRLMAEYSGIFYGDPSSRLKLIGITGTNGKTTTSYLIRTFLTDAGFATGLLGTIDYKIGDQAEDSKLTTPDSVELNMMLSEMLKKNTQYCVMEVSSIALMMERVYGLKFETAVFTNLTSEHLDFHKNMENYFQAKKILFNGLSETATAVSNADDTYGVRILEDCKARKVFYSEKADSDLRSFNEKLSLSGLEFDVEWKGKTYNLKSNLSGRFNIYNILASVSAVLQYDIDMTMIQNSLLNFQEVRGRFNRVKLPNGAIAVIDYSHTSDSLKNAIESAREIVDAERRYGKVITVFGCGGNKDRTKRSVMGELASVLSDHAIITSDNPRFEDPMDIISEIVSGIKDKKNFEIIESREDAIKRGIEISKEGDIVLICGKGHETYQEIKGVRTHFDDREIVGKYSHTVK